MRDWRFRSKGIHGLTFFGTLGLLSLGAYRWPDLTRDPSATFDYIGVGLALYGLVFAIIEVIRTKSAVQLADKQVATFGRRLDKVYGVRGLVQCAALIENALRDADEVGYVSLSSLTRIATLYSAEFAHVRPEEDSHRARANALSAHAHEAKVARKPTSKASGLLKAVLMEMAVEVAQADSRKSMMEVMQ